MLSLLKNWPFHLSLVEIVGFLLFLLCVFVPNSQAQTARSQINVSIVGDSRIRIQIRLSTPANSWSFLNAYGGVVGLAERIEKFQAHHLNQPVYIKRLSAGEYRSDEKADEVVYEAYIPPSDIGQIAHVSWLTSNYGILMLADLLPESISEVSVVFVLPAEWNIGASVDCDGTFRCLVDEPGKQVFLIGRQLRATSKQIHGIDLGLVIYGKWPAEDQKVLKSATKIVEWYLALTNFRLRSRPTILLAPLPRLDSGVKWKAETRGATIVLLVNSTPSFNNFLGQVAIIFTHEILHLWVPNSLQLTGDYDWFFEGFTSYVALQTALNLELIGFREYLDTLARVYDSYRSYPDDQTLIEASERRWTSSTPVVYDKGMLVAFLYDLVIRSDTEGRSSLADSYRSLFTQHANEPANANDVIIKLLTSSPATEGFSATYIESRNRIQLEKILPSFGFEMNTNSSNSHLTVRSGLAEKQKALMRSLGYRN
jgi:hypothetical protein